LQFKASLGKKGLQDPISTEKSWAWWAMPVIPVMAGSVNRLAQEKKRGPISKISKSKKGWGMAQW
jgi:cytochrome c-type biogenesis protein CcmH/NrfF